MIAYGFGTHLFIKELGKNDIGAIAENKEKYISLNVKTGVKLAGVSNKEGKEEHKNIQLRFIGSCRFMPLSLHRLASNLDDDQCNHLKEFYKRDKIFQGYEVISCISIFYMDS